LLQLAALYRSLASGGYWVQPHFHPGSVSERNVRRVWRGETSFVLGELLLDLDEEGRPLPHVLRTQGAEGRDWILAGFSERYTLVLRVQPPRGAVGFQPQAVWRDLLSTLHRGQPEQRLPPPPGVVSQVVAFEPPLESARREWFVRGTEVERVFFPQAPRPQPAPPPRILLPQDGALVDVSGKADDPAFRLHLEASTLPAGAVWRLDGVLMGNSLRVGWRPLNGRHVLELLGPEGLVLDSITFAVRGVPE
jgi:penicillin-binding protein 1C